MKAVSEGPTRRVMVWLERERLKGRLVCGMPGGEG